MNNAKRIVEKFGGQSAVANLIGKGQSTVQYWVKTGIIPARWQPTLLRLAKENNINLVPSDFIPEPATKRPNGKRNNNNKLNVKRAALGPPIKYVQGNLFHIEKQVELDGIEMADAYHKDKCPVVSIKKTKKTKEPSTKVPSVKHYIGRN